MGTSLATPAMPRITNGGCYYANFAGTANQQRQTRVGSPPTVTSSPPTTA